MKITRETNPFVPVVIRLNTETELALMGALARLAIRAADRGALDDPALGDFARVLNWDLTNLDD